MKKKTTNKIDCVCRVFAFDSTTNKSPKSQTNQIDRSSCCNCFVFLFFLLHFVFSVPADVKLLATGDTRWKLWQNTHKENRTSGDKSNIAAVQRRHRSLNKTNGGRKCRRSEKKKIGKFESEAKRGGEECEVKFRFDRDGKLSTLFNLLKYNKRSQKIEYLLFYSLRFRIHVHPSPFRG